MRTRRGLQGPTRHDPRPSGTADSVRYEVGVMWVGGVVGGWLAVTVVLLPLLGRLLGAGERCAPQREVRNSAPPLPPRLQLVPDRIPVGALGAESTGRPPA